jgi:peptidoglycan hydrolase FlgJ
VTQISGTLPGVTAAAASATKPAADPSLVKAAQAFEAVFVRQMIGAMRSASLSDGMFDNSATEQFRDMADAKTADALAQSHAMGIADLLLRQLSPMVPATSPSAAPDGTDK